MTISYFHFPILLLFSSKPPRKLCLQADGLTKSPSGETITACQIREQLSVAADQGRRFQAPLPLLHGNSLSAPSPKRTSISDSGMDHDCTIHFRTPQLLYMARVEYIEMPYLAHFPFTRMNLQIFKLLFPFLSKCLNFKPCPAREK